MNPVQQPTLDDILKPGRPLPPDDVMISKALEIMHHSPHGQKLAEFAVIEKITIKVIPMPQPTAYLPETHTVYIGFNRNNPVSPAAFVLMLTGILREAQQEVAGVKHPSLQVPRQDHIKMSLAKHEDKLWHMCSVAVELNDQSAFAEYKFLDELGKMGHTEVLELFLKQEHRE
jgi:hypothetical protein